MMAALARRAGLLLCSAGGVALLCWSETALAACETPPAGGVLAVGETCFVSGTFATTANDAIGGQATGVGALISGPEGEGTTITFSTTGASANGLQADTGGVISLTPTAATPGTVMTTGAGSFGLLATGSGKGEDGPVASQINVRNLNVSTTGPTAFGVQADTGASASLVGGSVMTSGPASEGLAVLGAGSTIQASGIAVTTHGDSDESAQEFATGIFAFTGGSMTFSGGSITTTGASADGVAVLGSGASIVLNGGTEILTTGNGSGGLVMSGAGALLSVTGVSVTTHGDADPSNDGNLAIGAYNGVAETPTGGTLELTNTIIVTTGAGADGVNTNSGGVTTISGGSVTTSELDTSGIDVESSAQVTMTGGTVTTSGNGSQGFLVEGTGSTLTANGVSVSSSGTTDPITTFHDFAMQAPDGGHIVLNGGSASTSGFNSTALMSRDGGSIDATNVVVSTTGATALGLLSFNQFGAGGNATFSGGSITTSGASADAVASDGSGSNITLGGGTTILTTGNGSAGLVVAGSGAALTATGIGITTHGDEDTSDGFLAFGAYNGQDSADGLPNGGTMKLTDTAIVTTGSDAHGVETNSGGQTTIGGGSIKTSGNGAIGLFASGAGSTIVASGAAVTTSGGFDPAMNSFASGILALNGGSVTFTGGSITTNGANSDAVSAVGGGASVTLNGGASVLATGDGADGLTVVGSGASLTANGIAVTTHGNVDPTFGFNSIGAFNGGECSCVGTITGGGMLSLTDTTIVTTGTLAQGVLTQDGGQTTISGGSVTTSGIGSHALFVTGAGSSITATGVAVATSGNFDPSTNSSSNGLDAVDGAKAVFSGGSISTAGNAAYAVVADGKGFISLSGTTIGTTGNGSGGLGINGSGSEIDASGVTITTTGGIDPVTGQHSYGIYNGPFGEFASGGVAKITDLTISTQGAAMFGVLTSVGGSTTITGGSYSTSGSIADVIVGQGAGSSVSVSGATITSTGLGSPGATLVGAGSSMSLSNDKITTSGQPFAAGRDAVGVFNGTSANGGFVGGGALTITNSTITTSGVRAAGVVTANGGQTNVTGGSVSTTGQDAHALFVRGLGSQANLDGVGTFNTTGSGAIGLYAALGGAISATGLTMTTVTTSGGVSAATGLGAYGVNADGAGSQIKLGLAAITTSGIGATGLFASDRAASGAAGAITATGTLNVSTKNASAAAVALQGNGATIAATGGGTITAAGTAIAFMGGTGQSATFDNFAIGNLSGDLVFADPSTATLNFNTTTANAGSNNLLNATAGSAMTLNASASTLTGAMRTDAASTSTVNLTNNTTWNLTGPSTVTNLNVTHSIIIFAPPGAGGAFRTLTVNNYAGNGANVTMNVALAGSGSGGDQIIINGGKATGSTQLTINNVGGLGGQTSGNGIPLILTRNGGSVSSDAFSLANAPMAGGFKYTLEETDNSFFLVSSPTATVGGITNSINNVAKAQQSQMITNRVLGSILLGATQQVSCSSCGGGFASFGSFALGGQGRWSLSDNTTLIGGVSYNQYSASGVTVYNAPTAAAALIYDFVNWGSSRPFLEVGAGLTPYEQVNTTRVYPNGLTTGYGYSTAIDRNASLFGRAGWVDRLTPIDEAAAYVDLGRSWMQTGGSSEQMTAINPFPATVPNGLATLNVTRVGAQYTHLFNGNIEANVGAAVAYGFGAGAGRRSASSNSGRSPRARSPTRLGSNIAVASATASPIGWSSTLSCSAPPEDWPATSCTAASVCGTRSD